MIKIKKRITREYDYFREHAEDKVKTVLCPFCRRSVKHGSVKLVKKVMDVSTPHDPDSPYVCVCGAFLFHDFAKKLIRRKNNAIRAN